MRQPVPFGKYLLLDRVSVGGMAEVFKAKSYGVEGFEKIIAIKRILPSMGEDRDFIKMFIDEAKIVGQLAHANICQIFELGRIDGTHFIAMEYIWGKDVLQLQNRLRKLDQVMLVPMACHIIAKVCEGLDYAHRKRDPMGNPIEIVHRDCSPQNVIISYEGEVKIIDFGIAKAASRSSRTMAGVLKGKFGYMSPEQVRGLPLDRRSDIFALGTVLYEILTRERLFQAESDFSTLEKVRNVDIEPPRSVNRNIPEEVEAIVMKALAGDPDDRYQWCSEMHADLQRFLMSQEAVFTAKTLSAWMKEHFAAELTRERKLMEEYKKLGRDGLALAEEEPAESQEEEENEATMLGGPDFTGILGSPPGEAGQEDDGNDFAEEAPTEIFGEIKHDGPQAEASGARAAGPPPIPPRGPPSRVEVAQDLALSDAQTLLQPSGSALARAAANAGRSPSQLMPVPSPAPEPAYDMPSGPARGPTSAGSAGQGQEELPFDFTSSVPQVSGAGPARPVRQRSGRKPSLAKDIGIGFAIAVLVLGLFAGVKYFFFAKQAQDTPIARTGVIEVHVGEGGDAEAFLDQQPIGIVQGGQSITVKQLTLGSHIIKVIRAGAEPCEESVILDEEHQLTRVTCDLRAQGGRIEFEGLTPEHVITVDGTPVPAEDRAKPLELSASTTHEVAVMLDEVELQRFSVTLEPGETLRRTLPAPAPAASAGQDGDAGTAAQDEENQGETAGGTDERDTRSGDTERGDRRGNRGTDRRNSDRGAARGGERQDEKAPEEEKGYLVANTQPWAQVIIDGRDTGKTTPIAPRSKIALEPGQHKVTFVYKGQRFDYSITVKPGQTVKLLKTLPVGE